MSLSSQDSKSTSEGEEVQDSHVEEPEKVDYEWDDDDDFEFT
jgi:hypothetical protein